MTRPANVPANAEYDSESDCWVTFENTYDTDGYEYEVEKHYDEDGHLVMILEMEV